MAILYLLGSIIFGALGMIAIVASGDDTAPSWLSWAAWFLYVPAFSLLFLAFESFGVAGGYALWGAGSALLVALQGARWGDKLDAKQLFSIGLIGIGLVWFGLASG